MSESDSPQAIEPCELHARESQRLQPDRTPAEPSTRGEGTSHSECPYVTGTVTRYCTLTPLTLTDAERMLIQAAAEEWQEHADHWRDNDLRVAEESDRNAATLRGLLDRTKTGEM